MRLLEEKGILLRMETLSYRNLEIEVKRRPRQKRLGITVYPNGKIRVSANKSLSQREILKFLSAQQKWLEKSLEGVRKTQEKFPVKHFRSGETYTFVGKDYLLSIELGEKLGLSFQDQKMVLTTPKREEEWSETLRKRYFESFKKSFKDVAKNIMTQRMKHWSDQMGLKPTGVQFRGQKSIWGSCSPENKISLNYKLIVAPLEVIDYVIIHELAHIRHKDHSKNFWKLVENYTTHRHFSRQWLRENHYACDFLNKTSELAPTSGGV